MVYHFKRFKRRTYVEFLTHSKRHTHALDAWVQNICQLCGVENREVASRSRKRRCSPSETRKQHAFYKWDMDAPIQISMRGAARRRTSPNRGLEYNKHTHTRGRAVGMREQQHCETRAQHHHHYDNGSGGRCSTKNGVCCGRYSWPWTGASTLCVSVCIHSQTPQNLERTHTHGR